MMQNRGRPGGPDPGNGGGSSGKPGGVPGGSTGGQRNIGFGYTHPPVRTPGSARGEQGHAARIIGSAAGGAMAADPPQFWVNHDPATNVDRLHRTGCRYEQNKGETPLKGIGEDGHDGGWHPFTTEAEARTAFPGAVWCVDCAQGTTS